jgi:ADP-heptose:LPS heptosyltransferase
MKNNKILIIHTHGIGDWILFSPVLKSIIEKFPEHKLDVITGLVPTKNFINEYKNVNILYSYNFKLGIREYLKFLFNLLFLRYDVVLLTAGFDYWKIQLISLFLFRNSRTYGLLKSGKKNLFIKNVVYFSDKWHKSRINYELYNSLIGESNPETPINLTPYIPFKRVNDSDVLDVIIHPGCDSANKYRRWPIEKFKYVINKLLARGSSVGIILGPSEKDLISLFKEYENDNNFKLYINLPFLNLFEIIDNYKIVLTNDSAIGHIGGGLNKQVFSIFGPADYKDTGPLGDNITILYPKIYLECMPCVKEGGLYGCEQQTCLNSIDKQMVLNMLISKLEIIND